VWQLSAVIHKQGTVTLLEDANHDFAQMSASRIFLAWRRLMVHFHDCPSSLGRNDRQRILDGNRQFHCARDV